MKEIKIATLAVDLKKSKNYRDQLALWLIEKAQELRTLEDKDYVENPKWNYFI